MRALDMVLICCLALVMGCDSSPAVESSSVVSGQVLLGGEPLNDAVVAFSSPGLGAGGTAKVDESGNYEISDPLPAGTYEVTITPAPVPPPNPGEPVPVIAPSRIPQKYYSPETSGLRADVISGRNAFNFELQP